MGARRTWPSGRAIRRRFRLTDGDLAGRWRTIVFAGLCLSVLAVGCDVQGTVDADDAGDTVARTTGSAAPDGGAGQLVVGSEGEIPPLDPHALSGTVGLRIVDAMYDPLIREDLSEASDEAPDLVPALAESWDVGEDGTVYTFQIRSGVTFHDGTELDAEAVAANLDRIMDSGSEYYSEEAAGNMDFLTNQIASYEVMADDVIEISLEEPMGLFPRLLSDRRMSIISPQALSEYGDDIASNPVGTGPFVFDTWNRGQNLTVVRNGDYWGDVPQVRSVVYVEILESSTMASSLQAGDIDVIMTANSDQVAQLEGEDAEVLYSDLANSYFMVLNTDEGPTASREFRQALNYGIDRSAISEVSDGLLRPLHQAIPVGNAAYEDLGAYEFDPDRAEDLIEQSGLETPISMTVFVPSSGPGLTQAETIASLIQEDLAALDVELEFEYMEFATLIERTGGGLEDGVHGAINGWTTGAESPDWLRRMFGCDQQPPTGVNRGWYCNEEVEAVLDQARAIPDDNERTALFQRAGELITEDAPMVFLYQDRFARIVGPDVQGFVSAPSPYVDLTTVSVDR